MFKLSNLRYFVIATYLLMFSAGSVSAASSNKVATKANELKVKACEMRQENVRTRMNNMVRMSENMIEVFDKISLRAQDFYREKVMARGGNLKNFDALVQQTALKKQAADAALLKAGGDAEKFNCADGNARASLTLFTKDMQTVKSALKDYRTSVKNLVTGIHGVSKNLNVSPTGTN